MGSDRKQIILKEAIATTAELGFKRTNARSIAERLEIQPSNIFYYFKTEPELIKAMLQQIVLTNSVVVSEVLAKQKPSSSREKLVCYIAGNLEWSLRNPDHVSVLLFGICEGQSDPSLLSLITNALSAGEEKVYHMITAGIAEGEFHLKGKLKPREVAKAIHQTIIGHTVRSITEKPSKSLYLKRIEAVLEQFIS